MVIVGRSPDCDLVIPHKSISRTHLKINKQGQSFFITDLGSSNGTKINNLPLEPQKRYELKAKDELTIGDLSAQILDISINKSEPSNTGTKLQLAKNDPVTSTIRISSLKLDIPERSLDLPLGERLEPALKNPISAYTKKKSIETQQKIKKRNTLGIILYFGFVSMILITALIYLLSLLS